MKKFLLSVFVSSFSLLFSQEKSRAEEYLSSLSKIEQVSQVFLVNVEGNVKYKAVEFYKGKPVIPGGILLFSYNIGHSKEQVKNYIQSIKNYSKEKGKDVKSVCEVGCIGCKLCMRVCESNAITVENNLAKVDYEKCIHCMKCIEKCPTKIIKH